MPVCYASLLPKDRDNSFHSTITINIRLRSRRCNALKCAFVVKAQVCHLPSHCPSPNFTSFLTPTTETHLGSNASKRYPQFSERTWLCVDRRFWVSRNSPGGTVVEARPSNISLGHRYEPSSVSLGTLPIRRWLISLASSSKHLYIEYYVCTYSYLNKDLEYLIIIEKQKMPITVFLKCCMVNI